MDIPELIALGALVFWILFFFAVLHGFRAAGRRREKRQSAKWAADGKGSPTSNSLKAFRLIPETMEKKGAHMRVTGMISGTMPARNNVIYLEAGEERVPVTVLSLKKLDMPNEEKGVRIRMTISGVPRALALRLNGAAEPDCSFTNLRKAAARAEHPVPEAGIRYPVVVTAPVREMLSSAGVGLFGLAGLGICAVGLYVSPDTPGYAIFMGACGLLFTGFGFGDVLFKLTFRLTAGEEQVTIRKWGGKTVYHINNLRWRASLASDNSEKWTMVITDTAGGRLASVNSRYHRYDELLAALRRADTIRREREQDRRLYRWLCDTTFYIPSDAAEGPEPGTIAFVPSLMRNRENGTVTVFLYERREDAERKSEGNPVIPSTIQNAAALMEEKHLDMLLIWHPGPEGPECIELTPERWRELDGAFGEKNA